MQVAITQLSRSPSEGKDTMRFGIASDIACKRDNEYREAGKVATWHGPQPDKRATNKAKRR